MDKTQYALTLAADYDSDRRNASERFYAALERLTDGEAVIDLEEAFNDCWQAAASAVARLGGEPPASAVEVIDEEVIAA